MICLYDTAVSLSRLTSPLKGYLFMISGRENDKIRFSRRAELRFWVTEKDKMEAKL